MAGYPVNNAQDFNNLEGQLPLDELITVVIVREQDSRRLELATEALKDLDGGKIDRRLLGAKFEELPLKLRSARIQGVLLSELESGSQAARSGLRPGDLVIGVNRKSVRTLAEFQAEISLVSGSIYLQIRRKGGEYVARID